MSSAKPQPTAIPPELDAEMTPAVRDLVWSLQGERPSQPSLVPMVAWVAG